MKSIKELPPKLLWTYFSNICKIPRPSKKEDAIIRYLLDWAKNNNIRAKKDRSGNILMKKPASPGMEKRRSVLLQSHMDMVCEKNSDVEFNFETDPIQPWIDGDWVKAKGTTLGADNGIGMAAQMAVLKSSDLKHGPVECLFTVDEETGLTGASELEKNFFESEILLNLDSEDEGELFIGCAGGIDTLATFTYTPADIPDDHIAYRIDIKGLKGGHSGGDIHRGLGNANKLLNRLLWYAAGQWELKLSLFNGGNLSNAIPREAFAVVSVPQKYRIEFTNYLQDYAGEVKYELAETESDLKIIYEEIISPKNIIDLNTQQNLLNALYACPHGVYAMSLKVDNLVETSNNLAFVRVLDRNKILVTTSQRSSIESSKTDIANMVSSVFNMAGAEVVQSEPYPGWAPDPSSEILQIAISSYKKLYGKKPVVRAIHAGLECGLFLEKYSDLDMISFGPTLRGVHSPDEKIFIPSVLKWWDHLVLLLSSIPDK
ncbi:MAG: aminoacyl-histidine dipeptidase [Desulfobacterales bacterium]|nr:aminoacyl-histidine dipeptidase [Desulfobacterales bacterium]